MFVLAIAGDDFAFDAPRPLRHVVEIISREVDLHFRQRADLSLFQGDGAREMADVFPQLGGHAAQVPGALYGRFTRPVFLRSARGGEGAVNVFGG